MLGLFWRKALEKWDTELWLKSTWRCSARFATLQLSSSNRVCQSEEFLYPLLIPHQLSPHLQHKFPALRYKTLTEIPQDKQSWKSNADFCGTEGLNVALESCCFKFRKATLVWLGLTSNSSTNADDCDLPAIIGLTGRTPSSTPPHSWVGEPEQGQQDQALIN